MSRITGTVKWFNGARASGFIEEDGQSDVFVRHVVFQGVGFRSLQENGPMRVRGARGSEGVAGGARDEAKAPRRSTLAARSSHTPGHLRAGRRTEMTPRRRRAVYCKP